MKRMKRLLTTLLAVLFMLCMSVSLVGCQNEATYNAEYTFDKITFRKSDALKIEDLNNFLPSSIMLDGKSVKTIKEFENLLRDNLDTYSIVHNNNGVNERIYLAPKYHSIIVKTDEILSVGIMNDGVLTYEDYTYTKKDYTNSTVYLTENEIFTFSENTMTYDFSFPLEPSNSFVVIYNYKS